MKTTDTKIQSFFSFKESMDKILLEEIKLLK